MIKNQLLTKIKKALGNIDDNIELTHPANPAHGDFTTNIALRLAKEKKRNPMELAKEIAEKIKKGELIETVEVITPGFINIFLTEKTLTDEIIEIMNKRDNYGKSESLKNKKIIVEYTDPNPFKEFHIGHLYSNLIGESLSRILEANSATVVRANYFGDIGAHVAKAIWGLKKKIAEEEISIEDLEKKTLSERVQFLGQGYALGSVGFEKDAKSKEEITSINRQIYIKDPDIYKLYEVGRRWSLDAFEEIYKRLGNNNGKGAFDKYYPEREVGEAGLKYVKANLKKGIFEESEGAVIFPGEREGLHNRVFINSLGLPTYEAKELGLAPRKYEDFSYDISLIVAGREILEYFKVLLAVLAKINPELAQKTKHIAHGMIRIPEGKMSSRSGNIITGSWLLDELQKKALEITKESKVAAKKGEKIAEKIGLSAVKYSLLKSRIGDDIEFDMNTSVSFDGNSGPYLLYTYVRCKSILVKEAGSNFEFQIKKLNNEELAVVRKLFQFPELVQEAAQFYSPHIIATFLYELAKDFNFFYQKHSVLKAERDSKQFRLALTNVVSQILKNGLGLLGIETVEKM